MGEKDEVYYRILNVAIHLDLRFGHLKWKMSQLGKSAKVSRPLIYYYFGKSKEDILSEAVTFFGTEFSGASETRWNLWKQGKFVETLMDSRATLKKIPALIPFYFLNRHMGTKIGETIRGQENNFKKKITKFFPTLTSDQIDFAFACMWGLVFAPELSEKAVLELDQYLKKASKTEGI